jgi:hypothetical protein
LVEDLFRLFVFRITGTPSRVRPKLLNGTTPYEFEEGDLDIDELVGGYMMPVHAIVDPIFAELSSKFLLFGGCTVITIEHR